MKTRLIAVLAAFALICVAQPAFAQREPPRWSIVIHGGAGVIARAELTRQQEAQYRAALGAAVRDGGRVLRRGGSAVDAVETAISRMEDDPLFNAGRGAVFTAEGRNELDASIMDGRTRAAGAVAGITRTRHPITLARRVMEHSPHVMLIGDGAEAFARAQGLDAVAPSFFFTERRWRQLEQNLRRNRLPIPHRPAGAPPAPRAADEPRLDNHQFGTVGAVALDTHGNIAAGTSTGGTTGKRWGRVGDTPLIGAGTYAQNGVCGVSATGAGEYFIRIGVAREICARMQLRNASAQAAADAVIAEVGAISGDGGVIVMDGRGRVAYSMNTSGMYRARLRQGGSPEVRIFASEERQ